MADGGPLATCAGREAALRAAQGPRNAAGKVIDIDALIA